MPDAQLTFVGTATTVLRLGPFTLLTDPNFLHRGDRAYLGYGLSSRRLTEPALSIPQLPPLDAVVLSHLHGDHWDRHARDGLPKELPIITTRHAAPRLRSKDKFRQAIGLKTWESHQIDRDGWTLTVTSVPAAHSGNAVLRLLLPPVMGSVLDLTDPQGQLRHRLYLTGDTMPVDALDEIPSRFPDLGAAVVHMGGTTLPGGFVVTMTGEMAVQVLQRLQPRAAVPVHYDDYGLFKSGLDDFREAVAAADLQTDVRYVERGATVDLS